VSERTSATGESDVAALPALPSVASGGRRSRLTAYAQRHPRFWAAVACAFVVVGVAGSLLGAGEVARSDASKQRLGFHLVSTDIALTLKLAIQHEEDLTYSASAFITGNPSTSAADFDRWAEAVHALQRYPELQTFGLVTLVPASRLAAFEAYIAAHPIRPLGPHSTQPSEPFAVFPPGRRPYYCLAVAGLARSLANFVPKGTDYCEIAPTLITARASGLTGYAPFPDAGNTDLGIETPVYRGATAPSTPGARVHAFIGWIGEVMAPQVLIKEALQGHPGVAVTLRYDSRDAHVSFTSGKPWPGAETTTMDLRVGREDGLINHEGWTVQTYAAGVGAAVTSNSNSLVLLIAGTLLSLALGALLYLLATGRTRALALVHEKTRELSHQALHDTLTGLPNRALVLDRAQQMLARAAREQDSMVGALFIDVDGFKHVNDSLGHAAGDRLLQAVADRLRVALRDHDTAGRLGGDEFVVLVEAPADAATVDLLADRITQVLREPMELDARRKPVSATVSIGVTVGQYTSPDDLLRDADLALYAAKAAGRDRYALYDASMSMADEGRRELEADLSAAIAEEEFSLAYQPIFDLASSRVVGVEALIRWDHPRRGLLLPDSFIPLAEESGLIVPIGRWVLDEACRQAAAWGAEGLRLGLAVNVSAFQLGRDSFADDVRGTLRRTGLSPSSLTLEITETALMRDVPAAAERLRALKALGVLVAIDDFGTGYASLSQLQRMPVDILKIDRTFVEALNDGGPARELLEAILGVGQSLSLIVVAEGVEQATQRAALQAMGCVLAQGDFLSRPVCPEAIPELLATRGRRLLAHPQPA
jgi:diguanylate cyclase (GGDEF)-like protein